MFCSLKELRNESDVEQKLVWPLLTTAHPDGLGFSASDILTKANIRRLEIGKGDHRRLYFPDYVVVLAGLPLLVVEAKAPGESLDGALDEARLYANELNARFPAGINPCRRVIASDGHKVVSAPVDTLAADISLAHADLSAAHDQFAHFVDLCNRPALQDQADGTRRLARKPKHLRPVSLVGGLGFQSEELPSNTFGATIVGDYGHVFSPRTRHDRTLVVRNAYIPSLRRERYVEPIDRLIRAAVSPTTAAVPAFESTGAPKELEAVFADRRRLENQVLLLIGSVGSGKSTFVDYVSLVALPEDIRDRTIWVRVNLNEAPLTPDLAYRWLADAIVADLRDQTGEDVDNFSVLEKVFRPELNAFRRGPVSLFETTSAEFKTRLVDEVIRLKTDSINLAKCFARYACGGPGKLMIVVLDNCDKRTRDEQLMMFQIAQWVQTEFRCLVILPIRDVTFERHRHEPPLDTAIKSLAFRIEPPSFANVLRARVHLALREMESNERAVKTLSYVLPNGIRVNYPASDQAVYLASILRSLYEHDRFVRRVMTGLAGRDVRRALEIFLDFCISGHIGEDEIYKIRFFEGKYVLPLSVIARVLLRMQRRFYDGSKAYIKNIVQCDPNDPLPDHFVRLSILHWLEQSQRTPGPAGVQGFHAVGRIVQDLVQLGHDATRVRAELLFLAKEGCVVAEHLRLDSLAENDLVKLTASGLVHLQLMANPDYLAACAEDTWVSDSDLAKRVATRIGSRGRIGHFSRLTTAKNASDFVEYLRARAAERLAAPDTYLDKAKLIELNTLREAEAAVSATEIDVSRRLYVGNLPYNSTADDIKVAFQGIGVPLVDVALPSAPGTLGRNRGFAFVEVADSKAAMDALDSTELAVGGRSVVINEAHQPKSERSKAAAHDAFDADVSDRIWVGNLPPSATEAHLRSLFDTHGFQVRDIYLSIDRQTQTPRFAFVSMTSKDEAVRAIGALNGTVVEGQALAVRPAAPRATR